MLKTIIVEDEHASQLLLKTIIENYCPQLHLAGVASNIEEAKWLIKSHSPDLIFLDIELKEQTGFDLLDAINFNTIKIIFTTAYDQYAVKAFKYRAIDYVLKPYSPKDIIMAVNKAKEKQYDDGLFERLKTLMAENLTSHHNSKLEVSTLEGIQILDIDEIIRVEASGSYSKIQMDSGKSILVSKLIKEIETQLPLQQFCRVHKSHLINLNFVKSYVREDGGYILLSNTDRIPVARRRKDDFLSQLSRYNQT